MSTLMQNNNYNTDSFLEGYLACRWPHAIWQAVLEQAIRDILSGSEELRDAAQYWIDDEVNAPRRFEWVCENLALEPSAVRRGIERRLSVGG